MSADAYAGTKAAIHPSHDVYLDDDAPDPHSPAWRCSICEETECAMCKMPADSELAHTCAGFAWWDGIKVIGDDGITRTVRKSGIGWPR